MGLQKYRADKPGAAFANGGIPWSCHWIGGPTLALIRNCVIENRDIPPRTVYITGEADSAWSLPAAARYKGKTIRGYATGSDEGLVFRAMDGEG